MKGTKTDERFVLLSGAYHVSTGFLTRHKEYEQQNACFEDIVKACGSGRSHNLHVLVYIHGYLAENPWFASLSGYKLHQEIFDDSTHDIDLVLSLQWDSGFQYQQNRLLAIQKGMQYGVLLNELESYFSKHNLKARFSFLLHSMGNIVFEGITNFYQKTGSTYPWDQVFLCAADLPSDVFDGGLAALPDIARDAHVLFHNNDNTLRIANYFMPFRRLGIYGREDITKHNNIHELDATRITGDDTAVGSRFSHHRYFYGSKNVVNYINSFLGRTK